VGQRWNSRWEQSEGYIATENAKTGITTEQRQMSAKSGGKSWRRKQSRGRKYLYASIAVKSL
jgi:hypothetical protein